MSTNNALSGMNAASKNLAVTSNNIANSATTGFKKSRAEFADVYAAGAGAGMQVGAGVRLAKVAQQFDQGDVTFTNRELDFAISGNGFFTLNSSTGTVYSRAGNFGADANGFVVNPAGHRLQVFQPSLTGDGFDSGRMADLRITTEVSAPQATNRSEVITTLPANAPAPATTPFDPTDSTSFSHTTSMTVFDSLGSEHTQTLYYVKTANPNEWQLYAQIDDAPAAMVSTLQYSDTGALVTPANGDVVLPTFTPATGAAPMDITVNLGKSVQYGSAFVVNSLSQNGNTTGEYTGLEVSGSGVVTARYSNGVSKTLGQVAMTRFNNPQGLESLGDNAWASTTASGAPMLGSPGTSGFGQVTGGALESSTVNLTEELINMITAQRTFQANSQVISTQDQIMQTVINLR
jgi:flagellar hook protein FlgE